LFSLVVEHDVGLPYPVGWHADELHASKVLRIPSEFVVIPDLEKQKQNVRKVRKVRQIKKLRKHLDQ